MSEPALTWLYVPGDRPDRFEKAAASGTDRVIIDLEDAVAPGRKDEARDAVAAWLSGDAPPARPPVEVRINAFDTAWTMRDVDAMINRPGLAGIRLPKAEDPAIVAALCARLPEDGPVHVHLLIETARGLEAAGELARADPLVRSITLGEADLRSELGILSESGLAWARGRIVVAAAAAGLPPPAMSVYTDLEDDAGLAASCREGRALGFLGRAAIHPRQLPVIEASFMPDQAEIEQARAIRAALDEALGRGSGTAVLPGGRFVDRAMAGRADRILALASRR